MCRILVPVVLTTSSIRPERTSFPGQSEPHDHFVLDMEGNETAIGSVESLSLTFRLSHRVKGLIY
jgi:hypothetical protein